MHGRRKDFFQGEPVGDFPKIFPGGAKSGEIWFLLLEIEKTTFFANNFKIQGGQGPPAPPPTPMTSCLSCPHAYIVTWFLLCRADI